MSVRRLDQPANSVSPALHRRSLEPDPADGSPRTSTATSLSQDVRLTMGGEPTYVGIDEPESLAVEPRSPRRPSSAPAASPLFAASARSTAPRRPAALRARASGTPARPLPRWAFHCISRIDGVPVWERGDLDRPAKTSEYAFTPQPTRSRFLRSPHAHRLRSQLRRTSSPPSNDFGDDATESGIGYILPLRRRPSHGGTLRWSSQLWFPRPDRLDLSHGDSPIGYRIPPGPSTLRSPRRPRLTTV